MADGSATPCSHVSEAAARLRELQPREGNDSLGKKASRLRSRLRGLTTLRRLAFCAVLKCKPVLGVWVTGKEGSRKAQASGLMTCNSVHACPVCARKIRARRMKQLEAALVAGLDWFPTHHWVMLSVTMRHHGGMRLRWQRDVIFRAWRRCRQNGSVQRIFKTRVEASARAFEVTHSLAYGWHPHLHVALLTTEWTEHEKAVLRNAFLHALVVEACRMKGTPYEVARSYVDDEGERKMKLVTVHGEAWDVAKHRQWAPFFTEYVERALRWSQKKLTSENQSRELSSYLTDIGLELSMGATKTTHAEGSRTPWQIAEAAVSGDERSKGLWWEYESATKGTRCIELDDRAADLAKVPPKKRDTDDPVIVEAGEASGALDFSNAPLTGPDAVFAELDPEMLPIVRRYERFIDPRATTLWLEAAAATRGPLTAASIRASVDECVRGMVESLQDGRYEELRTAVA